MNPQPGKWLQRRILFQTQHQETTDVPAANRFQNGNPADLKNIALGQPAAAGDSLAIVILHQPVKSGIILRVLFYFNIDMLFFDKHCRADSDDPEEI